MLGARRGHVERRAERLPVHEPAAARAARWLASSLVLARSLKEEAERVLRGQRRLCIPAHEERRAEPPTLLLIALLRIEQRLARQEGACMPRQQRPHGMHEQCCGRGRSLMTWRLPLTNLDPEAPARLGARDGALETAPTELGDLVTELGDLVQLGAREAPALSRAPLGRRGRRHGRQGRDLTRRDRDDARCLGHVGAHDGACIGRARRELCLDHWRPRKLRVLGFGSARLRKLRVLGFGSAPTPDQSHASSQQLRAALALLLHGSAAAGRYQRRRHLIISVRSRRHLIISVRSRQLMILLHRAHERLEHLIFVIATPPNGRRPNGRCPNGRRPNNRRPNGRRPHGRRPNGRRPNGRHRRALHGRLWFQIRIESLAARHDQIRIESLAARHEADGALIAGQDEGLARPVRRRARVLEHASRARGDCLACLGQQQPRRRPHILHARGGARGGARDGARDGARGGRGALGTALDHAREQLRSDARVSQGAQLEARGAPACNEGGTQRHSEALRGTQSDLPMGAA